MRRRAKRAAVALWLAVLAAPTGAQTAADLAGLWQTGARAGSWGHVRIAPCGPAWCGTLVGGGGARVEARHFGTRMIEGMEWDGAGFAGGRLLDVERGHWYASRIRFQGADRIRVDGCVLGGLICGGQTWTRMR